MRSSSGRLVTADGSLDLTVLMRQVRARQWLIWLMAAVALVAAITYLKNVTYRYTVSYEITPIQGASDSLSTTLGKVGGIAALAGVNLPQGSDSTFKLYLEGLQSRDVAEELAGNQLLMRSIFYKEWDAPSRTWKEPQGTLHDLLIAFRRFLNVPGAEWRKPDGARLQQFLEKEVIVVQDPKSVTASVSLKIADPEFGRLFLTDLHDTTDGLIRRRAIIRTDSYIVYLTNKLGTVLLAEHRSALSQALGDQERLRMIASSPKSYTADIFQYPAASAVPTTPRPLFVILGALAGGLLIGLAIVLARIFLGALHAEELDQDEISASSQLFEPKVATLRDG